MLSADYFVEKIDEATEANREAKRLCNDVLSVARGMIQKLQNDIKTKDEHIFKLESELGHLEQEVRDLKSELQNCSEVASGSVTDGEAVHDVDGVVSRSDRNKLYSVIAQCYEATSGVTSEVASGSVTDGCEDRWIPCSEGMPLLDENVLIKVVDQLNTCRRFVPRTGYLCETDDPTTCAWFIWTEPGGCKPLTDVFKVIAWRPLPEDYAEPAVKDEPEEVKLEVGDFVFCVGKTGVKINAVYLREDEEHYWILDNQCLTQQPLDKNHWKLTKYSGYMSVVEWLTKL